jgi:hypothetical protein
MKTIFQECVELTKNIAGHEFLYFDSALSLKLSPHSIPFTVWAVCVSPKDELFVMDSDEQWHQVKEENGSLLVGNMYQRLKLMNAKYRGTDDEMDNKNDREEDVFANEIFEREEGL